MERVQRRRNEFLDSLFEPPKAMDGYTVRLLRAGLGDRFGPTREVALLSDGVDDLFVLPGWVSVRPGSQAEELVRQEGFEPTDEPKSPGRDWARYYRTAPDLDGVRACLAVVARAAGGRSDGSTDASLVHGFIAHQKTVPCTDPELGTEPGAPRAGRGRGTGVSVRLLDNGYAAKPSWSLSAGPATPGDIDPLKGIPRPKYLGRAAGHGTFIAGLVHQIAPDCETLVHLIANSEGFVDEVSLGALLGSLASSPPADVVILPFGGYSVKLGSFGTPPTPGASWLDPLGLRAALLALVRAWPGTLFVASAGNNDSSDRCFPAAFSEDPEFAGHLVSVAALDAAGYRAGFSNYGSWVSASALGVRLRSQYVVGNEHPDNDPDGPPETFRSRSFAQWSGTSFAAPLVAAKVAETLGALRSQFGAGVTAVDAWRHVEATSHRQREGLCGVRVMVDGVAYD